MKHVISMSIIILFLSNCCTNIPTNTKINDAFYEDFRIENKRIRGSLILDKFNGNLDSLTYTFYINYMRTDSIASAKGLSNIIESADEHYFETKSNSFIIGLLYRQERTILIDDAYTSKLDTIIIVNKNERFPKWGELSHIISKK